MDTQIFIDLVVHDMNEIKWKKKIKFKEPQALKLTKWTDIIPNEHKGATVVIM